MTIAANKNFVCVNHVAFVGHIRRAVVARYTPVLGAWGFLVPEADDEYVRVAELFDFHIAYYVCQIRRNATHI